MRSNVLDMAIGIIIGVAFGAIVQSLVADLIMPPLGLLLGKVDFTKPLSGPQGRRAGGPLSLGGSRAAGRRGHLELRDVREHDHPVRHRRFLHVPHRQGDELYEEEGGPGGADGQGLPILRLESPVEGHAVPLLHLTVEIIKTPTENRHAT